MADVRDKTGSKFEIGSKVSIALIKYNNYTKACPLVPSNCLVSINEAIPGIVNNQNKMKLPKPVFPKPGDKKTNSNT